LRPRRPAPGRRPRRLDPPARAQPRSETGMSVLISVLLRGLAGLCVLTLLAARPALAATASAPPLAGTLRNAEAWRAYKARFVSEQGRVVDTANGGISHSEGQGYGMLLAVARRHRETFERIWTWTRANLMVRDDQLIAWRWEPDKRPAVADMNDAS